jgi:hypothetical protein
LHVNPTRYRHPVLVLGTLAACQLVIAYAGATYFHTWPAKFAFGAVAELLLFSGGAIVAIPRLTKLLPEIQLLWVYADDARRATGNRRIQASVLEFLRPRLRDYLDRLRDLYSEGLLIEPHELGPLTAAAFRGFKGFYIGTDKNVPSRFRQLYPEYLEQQVRDRRADAYHRDTRFLIVSPTDLINDYRENPVEFTAFCDFHQRNQIALLQVDPEKAEQIRKYTELGTAEIGDYGGEYTIFFEPRGDQVAITLRRYAELSGRVDLFFFHLNPSARRIILGNGGALQLLPRSVEEIELQRSRMSRSELQS